MARRTVFWKKKPASDNELAAGSTTGLAPAATPYADAALDTVVGMLRAPGRYAFDITGVDALAFRRRCEEWAEHLAIGAPHPGGPGADEPRDPSLPRPGRRSPMRAGGLGRPGMMRRARAGARGEGR
jgi:hypothetical protein